MHFADAVRDARVEQDALCRCRLAGVDVRHDSDIPATIQRYGASHFDSSLRACEPAVIFSDFIVQGFSVRTICLRSGQKLC